MCRPQLLSGRRMNIASRELRRLGQTCWRLELDDDGHEERRVRPGELRERKSGSAAQVIGGRTYSRTGQDRPRAGHPASAGLGLLAIRGRSVGRRAWRGLRIARAGQAIAGHRIDSNCQLAALVPAAVVVLSRPLCPSSCSSCWTPTTLPPCSRSRPRSLLIVALDPARKRHGDRTLPRVLQLRPPLLIRASSYPWPAALCAAPPPPLIP